MANDAAWNLGWQTAQQDEVQNRERNWQLADQARATTANALLQGRSALQLKLPNMEEGPEKDKARQSMNDINTQIIQLFDPIRNPGALQRNWGAISHWFTGNKPRPTLSGPIPQVTTVTSPPAVTDTTPVTLDKTPMIPATSTDQGVSATPEATLNMEGPQVTLPGSSLTVHGPASVVADTPQERKRMAQRAQAQQMSSILEAAAPFSVEQQAGLDSRKAWAFVNAGVQDYLKGTPNASGDDVKAVRSRLLAHALGLRMTPDLKNFRNPATGETRTFDVNYETPGDPWVLTSTSMGVVRALSGQALGLTDALTAMANAGQQYQKPDLSYFSEKELRSLPANMKLQAFGIGSNVFWGLADQTAHTVNLGNTVYAMDQFGNVDTSRPLGDARVGSAREVPGMNPGETIKLNTTPLTKGATGAPAATGQPARAPVPPPATGQPAGGQPAPAAAAPTPQQLRQAVPAPPAVTPYKAGVAPATPSAKPPAQQGALGPPPPAFVKGTMLVQGRTVQPVVAAMSVVGAQVFGDRDKPPLWSYAKMYDNPQLGRALNKALTMNSLTMPGVHAEPGFWESLRTAAGLTGWTQEQINQAAVDARVDVQRLGGDDAMKFLSRIMGLQEDLSALRVATKASSAAGSIQNLTRAAPIYNVSSAQDFRNQLSVTMATAAASMKGYPIINPAYADYWQRGANAAATQEQVKVIKQHSPSTGQDRYSTDGGTTWMPGLPPKTQ